ncbi:MAG: chaperonin GroEL [Oscillospiraceae bacterium]|jgi:chaperonin GroEL
MKEIKFGAEATTALLKGADAVAKTVEVTYGPKGRSVVFNKGGLLPTVSNDASSILQYLELTDPYERDAAEFVSEAALKTANETGCGTTTTVILTKAILHSAIKNLHAGANPMLMRKGMEKAADAAIKAIEKKSLSMLGPEALRQVGIVAAGDEDIGNLVADGMMKTSEYGIVAIEESKIAESYIDFVEGIQFNNGYISEFMVTDSATQTASLNDPYILITDQEVSDFKEFIPILEMVHKAGGELVIIAKDVTGEALAGITHNIRRGVIKTLCVKAPGTAERVLEYLDDIAVMTGGEVITESFGLKLSKVKLSQFGRAANIQSTSERTIITDGRGKAEAIAKRVEEIKAAIAASTTKFDRDRHQDRLAKMTGGVSIVKIGGMTESEMRERKQKAEDALSALSAAVESGVVSGGGVALLDAIPALTELHNNEQEPDIKTGILTVLESLGAPVCQLAENIGLEGPAVLDRIKRENKSGFGLNVNTEQYGMMLDMGIADPCKAVTTALYNAAHTAALMVTSEAFVADMYEPKHGDVISVPKR